MNADLDDWIHRITQSIGGCHQVVTSIARQIYIRNAIATGKRQAMTTWPRSKGAVLHGKPGTGKTALALALAKTSNLPYIVVNGPDLFETEEGKSEAKLIALFEQAQKHSFSLLVLDDIDLLAGNLKGRKNSLDVRIASALLSCIDHHADAVFIIGTTSRLHAIDVCFTRSGRLDSIHELLIKRPEQRLEILHRLGQRLPFASETEKTAVLSQVARVTHGFVPSDLQSLCTQAILTLVKEQRTHVTWHDFQLAMTTVQPSNLGEYGGKIPNITFADLYGMDTIVQEIKTLVIDPFQHPEKYLALHITPPRGILVHGPPGVGKTMLCSALGSESGVNFIAVQSSEVRSKIVGESEANLAKLFAQANANSPCIIFIDQIDMLLPKRGTASTSENTSDRIVTSFLTAMDGLMTQSKGAQIQVLVVGATSRIEAMDSAVLRPGRFDEHIYIPLPDEKTRASIIDGLARKMPIQLDEQGRLDLIKNTEGWTGAQLENLFREAAMVSLRENVQNDKITMAHLAAAGQIIRTPSMAA